jgi:DNA-binding NtrC family response regulator
MAQHVLLIYGDSAQAKTLQTYIRDEMQLGCLISPNAEDALRLLLMHPDLRPDVVLYHMVDEESSLDSMCAIRNLRRDTQVVVLLGHPDTETAINCLTHGAADFLLTPFHAVQLAATVRNALIRRDLQIEARQAWAAERIILEDIDARSAALQATLFMARKLAEGEGAMVLEGAPGTGHEMYARAIHGSSSRRHAPFMAFNAAIFHSEQLERRLFGDTHHSGLLDDVQEGTLYLRNLATMPETVRNRMMRVVLREEPICPSRPQHRFVGRLVFAMDDAARRSNSNEKREISHFFSALNALPISLPYLREIPEDIAMLAMLHGGRYAALEGKVITGIAPPARQMLREISWPGNMEQLCHAVFNAVMCCQGSELQVEDFRYLFPAQPASVSQLSPKEAPETETKGVLRCVDATGNIRRLEEMEAELIRYALDRYSGHMSDVARHLGIGRSTLYRKLSSMGEK